MSDLFKRVSIIKKYFSEFEEEIEFDTYTFSGELTAKGCKLSYEELKKIILNGSNPENFSMRVEVFYEENNYVGLTTMHGYVNCRCIVEPFCLETVWNRI